MANGAEPMEAGGPQYVIYIRPSRGLIVQSWHWPASWHAAFERMAGQLGRAAALCVLSGLAVTNRQMARQLPIEGVQFDVTCRGTSIYIAVSAFTGPQPPGPGAPGGVRQQPHPAHGLVLGLRGSGKSFRVVVFDGCMPPIPAAGVLADSRADSRAARRADRRADSCASHGDRKILPPDGRLISMQNCSHAFFVMETGSPIVGCREKLPREKTRLERTDSPHIH